MPQRVLQLVDHFGPHGGMERFVHDLTRLLLSEGHDTQVVAKTVDARHGWGAAPIPTAVLPGDAAGWDALARGYAPDLVLWHAGPETAAAAARLGDHAPLVATVHGPICPAGSRLFRDRDQVCTRASGAACLINWYTRRCGTSADPRQALAALASAKRMIAAAQRCRTVYAVSEAIRQFLLLEGLPPSRVRVFDNTLGELTIPLPPLDAPPAPDEALEVLYAGRLVYSKGVQYLLRAIRTMRDAGVDVRCTIVGDGWYRSTLEQLQRSLDLGNHVRFTGQVSGADMQGWFDRAHVVVAPSVWPEPASLVVPEARRRGKPVVVFDVGGNPEWATLLNGIHVARSTDVEELARRIREASHHRPPEPVGTRPSHRADLLAELELGARAPPP